MTIVDSFRHGLSAYHYRGCRCDRCRGAVADYIRQWRAEAVAAPIPSTVKHGSLSTYNNYRCRCGPCCDARKRYDRERRTGKVSS